jgi:hypothetical protein
MAAAYYKVEVTLNSQAVSVGLPSPQSVSVTIPLIGPQGPVGATGPANSLAIGTVSTGAAGSNADATITGTAPNQTLNLTIPVGATGATGPTGPQGPTIADANAPATNNILWQIRTTAFTAASGGRYVASGTFTVTNPASGNDGELFQVVVASGTVTVNSVAYGASRWPVTVARISGAWTTLPNTLTENLTLNGTNNTAPNQTAASGTSLMTRALVQSQLTRFYLDTPMGYRDLSFAQVAYNSGTGTASTLAVGTGRTAVTLNVGDNTSRAGLRINQQGSWNGNPGNDSLNWGRAFELCFVGGRGFVSASNVSMFLVLGVATGDTTIPATGRFVGLEWTSGTNANVIVANNGGASTVTSLVTTASPTQFCVWINNKGDGTGDVFYTETTSLTTPLTKPSTASASWTGGPTAITSGGQCLTFGMVGTGASTGFNSITSIRSLLAIS